MNYSIIISPLFRLLYLSYPSTHGVRIYMVIFWSILFERKNKTFTRLLLGAAYFGGGGGGGGAYYRSLISSLKQMRLLLGALTIGGAYYRKFTVSHFRVYLRTFNILVKTTDLKLVKNLHCFDS